MLHHIDILYMYNTRHTYDIKQWFAQNQIFAKSDHSYIAEETLLPFSRPVSCLLL